MSKKHKGGSNAFSLLMSRKRQRVPNYGSRFVKCPVCEKHFPEKDINLHVDQCLLKLQGNSEENGNGSNIHTEATNGMKSVESGRPPETLSWHKSPEKHRPPSNTLDSISSTTYRSVVSVEKPNKPSAEDCPLVNSVPETLNAINLIADKTQSHGDGLNEEDTESSPATAGPRKYQETHTRGGGEDLSSDMQPFSDPLRQHLNQTQCEQSRCKQTSGIAPSVGVVSPNSDAPSQQSTLPSSNEKRDDGTARENAFSRMMSQSKVLFAPRHATRQCFHLDGNFNLMLRSCDARPLTCVWSTTLSVKDRSVSNIEPREYEVMLTSDVPSEIEGNDSSTSRRRFVRNHSRLSVPVLKSILQKSIRRRRPLPSVRVAMELADKSLGDLLRRLPVIILEDSTLHPDFDFLVWLMMAHSKDYIPTPKMLQRVMEIIFEIASCPWIDTTHIHDDVGPGHQISVIVRKGDESACTMESLHKALIKQAQVETGSLSLGKRVTLPWSMLVRSEYGGMRCDVTMLRQFATIWSQRFASMTGAGASNPRLPHEWLDVPSEVHRSGKVQSQQRIGALMKGAIELNQHAIDCLVLKDISIEGVDFHCSAIIESLLSDRHFCDLSLDLLRLDSNDQALSQSRLKMLLQRCMWNFGSGVNWRQSLIKRDESNVGAKSKEYASFWNELVLPQARKYQLSYIQHRLCKTNRSGQPDWDADRSPRPKSVTF